MPKGKEIKETRESIPVPLTLDQLVVRAADTLRVDLDTKTAKHIADRIAEFARYHAQTVAQIVEEYYAADARFPLSEWHKRRVAAQVRKHLFQAGLVTTSQVRLKPDDLCLIVFNSEGLHRISSDIRIPLHIRLGRVVNFPRRPKELTIISTAVTLIPNGTTEPLPPTPRLCTPTTDIIHGDVQVILPIDPHQLTPRNT